MSHEVLAFDLGASNGRAIAGRLDGEELTVLPLHRFPNDPVRLHGHLYWDVLRLFHEMKQGLIAARLQGFHRLQSVGIDTWGLDFGLLGAGGELLGMPYHYRDVQTSAILEEVAQIISQSELFARTGVQTMPVNTLYHLFAMKKATIALLDRAETLLMIPALLRYFFTGERYNEWTATAPTQLCNPYTHGWDRELIQYLGLPMHIFSDPIAPGKRVGGLLPEICEETGMAPLPVVAVAEHDTASAVVAVPTEQASFAYVSSGTWSLLGTEIAEPILSEQVFAWNFSNESGVGGTTQLLKSITGLWFIQECRRVWKNEGKVVSYADEHSLIEQAAPLRSFINPDDPMFINPPHMPRQIQHYCQLTRQPVPETIGELLRCIVESQAMSYRCAFEHLEQLMKQRFTGLYLVGGGVKHVTFCQSIANALARPVWAGPGEAAALGNVLTQYITLGYLKNVQHARFVVRNSFPITSYEPVETESWNRAYKTFCQVTQHKQSCHPHQGARKTRTSG